MTLSVKAYDRCDSSTVRAYDGSRVQDTYLVPYCPSDDHRTLVYTSHSRTMLLVFHSGYRVRGLPLDIGISYQSQAAPTPTPATGAGSSVVSSAVVAWSALFSLRTTSLTAYGV